MEAEFDLLWMLAARPGRTIDLRVARLRKKLGDDARCPRRIMTVRGEGYLLTPRL